MPILTISRQMGSLGDAIAEALARKLGWPLIDRSCLIERFFADITNAHQQHMLTESAKFYLTPMENTPYSYIDYLKNALLTSANQGEPALLIGFGSQVIFSEYRSALHVRITAPRDVRLARIRKEFRVSVEEASNILNTSDKKHKRFVQTVFKTDLTDPNNYDLTLNTARLTVDEGVAAILALHKEYELTRRIEEESRQFETIDNQSPQQIFQNESEEDFAKILDMFQLEWRYEPKTFPIEWDAEGNITLAFSPDFYLPKFDTYIELTTMNQKYVTEKNRKAKKVRELYPGTNIRIVYKKDFHSLIQRFNMDKGE
ncbi:MAG: cytidylate kinase family protein [Christensenellales bacterium]